MVTIEMARIAEAIALLGLALSIDSHEVLYAYTSQTSCLRVYHSLGFALITCSTSFVATCEQPYEHW